MARVTRADGVVAACVWDFAGERAPISAFWRAAREIDDGVVDESGLAGGCLRTDLDAGPAVTDPDPMPGPRAGRTVHADLPRLGRARPGLTGGELLVPL